MMGPRKKLKFNGGSSSHDDHCFNSYRGSEVESNDSFRGFESGSEANLNSSSSHASTASSSSAQLQFDNEKLRKKVAQLENQLLETNQQRSSGSDAILQKFGLEFANVKSSHLMIRDDIVSFPFEYFCIGQRSKELLAAMPKFSGITVVGKNFCATSIEFPQRPISLNIHIVWLTRYYYAIQAKEFTVVNHAKLQRTMVKLINPYYDAATDIIILLGKISSAS